LGIFGGFSGCEISSLKAGLISAAIRQFQPVLVQFDKISLRQTV